MITHKPHFQGGGNPYIAPELEIVTVEVEKGFAVSTTDYDDTNMTESSDYDKDPVEGYF